MRGTVEDWQGDAVYGYMSPISYAMSAEERAVFATLGCLEAIRSGTTTLVDPFRHVLDYAPAMAATGMRLWLSESCADVDTRRIRHGDYRVDEAFGAQFVERTEALIERFHGSAHGRVRCQVAAHATDNCSPAMLRTVRDLAAKHALTRTIHLAQSPGEVAAVEAAHGLTPAGYLEREGFLGPDLVGAHWTFCTRDDIALLAERGVTMAHTPASISRRGLHKALLGPIRDAGVTVAVGTDNMSEDMFQAMAFGSVVHRTGRGREREGGVSPAPARGARHGHAQRGRERGRLGRDRLDRARQKGGPHPDPARHAGDAAADQPGFQLGALRPSRYRPLRDGGWRLPDARRHGADDRRARPAAPGGAGDRTGVGADAASQPGPAAAAAGRRMTFSLAGRCARTGMLGGVIATSSLAVGSRCLYARAGLGVVLTQNRTDPRLGPRGLDLLAGGCSPAETIAALVASTPHAGWRQLAALDRTGAAAHHSGHHIHSHHAGVVGPDCVAVGNILRNAEIPAAMAAAFAEAAALDLPDRLLAALEAGDRAGGEVLPLRSAALLVAHRKSFPYVDLRVDASAAPLAALRALWEEYRPEADDFVTRALQPDQAGPPVR